MQHMHAAPPGPLSRPTGHRSFTLRAAIAAPGLAPAYGLQPTPSTPGSGWTASAPWHNVTSQSMLECCHLYVPLRARGHSKSGSALCSSGPVVLCCLAVGCGPSATVPLRLAQMQASGAACAMCLCLGNENAQRCRSRSVSGVSHSRLRAANASQSQQAGYVGGCGQRSINTAEERRPRTRSQLRSRGRVDGICGNSQRSVN